MPRLTKHHAKILQEYPRAVVHMRRQVQEGRFGFVFGSGISQSFEVPTWEALIQSLARDRQIQGVRLLSVLPPHAGAPYRTEMLFEHFRKKQHDRHGRRDYGKRRREFEIAAKWRELVRKHLYAKAPSNMTAAFKAHQYLQACLPLIRRSSLTVTYNFDDFLEQALHQTQPRDQRAESRGYETVTNAWMQFRREDSIIFHPNGVIPQKPMETPSDRFVFSEGSFVEQMMGIFAGDDAGLLHHLGKHTCLLIGASLEDETFRSSLARSAMRNPGNYHYYVRFLEDQEIIDQHKRQAISMANFKVYNLITLFLHVGEIRSLVELLNTDRYSRRNLATFAEEHGVRVNYRFYISGPMGVGKSTTINQFRNLRALDEWLEPRPEKLAKPPGTLSDEEVRALDTWIAKQFRLKNYILKDECEGIFVMDRGPLDPLAFTDEQAWTKKARYLLNRICPQRAKYKVQEGRVILLTGDSEELALRMLLTSREQYTKKKLKRNAELLAQAYCGDGVVTVDTKGRTPREVAQRVAEIIHLEKYNPPYDLHQRLEDIRKDGINVSK